MTKEGRTLAMSAAIRPIIQRMSNNATHGGEFDKKNELRNMDIPFTPLHKLW